MSSENQVESPPQNFCNECKSDLSKEPHLVTCASFLGERISVKTTSNQSDLEKIEADAKAEQEKHRQESELAAENARKQLEEKRQKEIKVELAKQKKESQKQQIIQKILSISKNANQKSLESMSLESLAVFYHGIIDAKVSEKKILEKLETYEVSCPICRKALGETHSIEDAQKLQHLHKAKAHNGNGWLGLALLFGVAASIAGAIIFYNKKKSEENKT